MRRLAGLSQLRGVTQTVPHKQWAANMAEPRTMKTKMARANYALKKLRSYVDRWLELKLRPF